jgi:hypothetical protein
MAEKSTEKAVPDRATYVKNRCSHPIEEIAQYGDQWVAWSLDGLRIVAHHADPLEVAAMIEAQGFGTEDVSFEWIPPGGYVETLLYAFSDLDRGGVPLARRFRSVAANSRLWTNEVFF